MSGEVMQRVLRGLATGYLFVAVGFGGVIALHSPGPAHDLATWVEERSSAATASMRAWFGNASPPASVTIPLTPFTVPLRDSEFEDGSRNLRRVAPAEPHVIPPQKSKTPLDVQFADAEVTPPVWNEGDRVASRVQANLSRELYANFDLFLYVSKAERGPWSQRMYVLAKQPKNGELALLHKWQASTGRETEEVAKNGKRMATDTPAGFYQLDPKRFYRKYHSSQWDMDMPNSMFFNWMKNGYATGLAIHGVSTEEEIALLGQRASSGCVHLSPEDSLALFNMIRESYKGEVPRFALDRKTMTVSNTGKLARAKDGGLDMIPGYRVLVYIENFGGEDRVSTLYMDLPERAG
jgi:hypothetical protein